MKKCERCGIYFDEAENENQESAVCAVCQAADKGTLYRVRHVATGRYLRVDFVSECNHVVMGWHRDSPGYACPKEVAEALGKAMILVSGDRDVEIEPVEN